jgi:hypothetical protein
MHYKKTFKICLINNSKIRKFNSIFKSVPTPFSFFPSPCCVKFLSCLCDRQTRKKSKKSLKLVSHLSPRLTTKISIDYISQLPQQQQQQHKIMQCCFILFQKCFNTINWNTNNNKKRLPKDYLGFFGRGNFILEDETKAPN